MLDVPSLVKIFAVSLGIVSVTPKHFLLGSSLVTQEG